VAEVVDELRARDEGFSVTLRPGEAFAVNVTVPVNPFTPFRVTLPR